MKKLVKKLPNYNYDFYQQGIYAQPIHHMKGASTMRMLVAKAMVDYLYAKEEIESVLDLGCGDGALLQYIWSPIKTFVGVDLSKANIEYAKSQSNLIEWLNEDLTTRKNKADLIIICETLEHLLDPVATFKKLDCKFLITSVPLDETPDKHSPFHVWGWSGDEFSEMISTRFKILYHIRVNKRTQLVLAQKK